MCPDAQANTGVQATNTVVTQCALHHFQYTTQSMPSYNYPQQQTYANGAVAASPEQTPQEMA